MTAKKPEGRPTIPVRGAIRKKRESIRKIDAVPPIRPKLKVSHRG